MIKVNFLKQKACPISEKFSEAIALECGKFEKKIVGEVEINIVSKKEIKKLNKEFRGIDSVTDVLSFGWGERKSFLGQIFICWERIKEQAKQFGVKDREEFARMEIHGLLHIVGFDHVKENESKKMFSLQEKILSSLQKKKII